MAASIWLPLYEKFTEIIVWPTIQSVSIVGTRVIRYSQSGNRQSIFFGMKGGVAVGATVGRQLTKS